MFPTELTIRDDFPAVDLEQWRELAEAALNGASFEQKLVTHTYEGIDIQPLYTAMDRPGLDDPFGFPGLPPFVRGGRLLGAVLTGWDLRQEHADPDLAAAHQAILEDVRGGVTSLLLCLDGVARDGSDLDDPHLAEQSGSDGLMIYDVDDLDGVLRDVPLDNDGFGEPSSAVGVALDAGAAFVPAAAMLVALWRRRQVEPANARGAFNADPLAELSRVGKLPLPTAKALSLLADLAGWTAVNYPGVTAVGVDTSPYHDAGATAADDLAFAIGTAVEYLRAMTGTGMPIDIAAGQFLFRIGLGTHHFLAIAKLRAARQLWARVIEACGGGSAAGAIRIHARTSRRVLTRRDPYVNLLRNTVGVFAAGIGGAEAITSVPFDSLIGLPDSFSRRVARNTLLVLQEEAHLHRVVDPAGGSWFLDQLTDQLAGMAWEAFQQLEAEGGMLRAIESGWVRDRIAATYARRAQDIARRKQGITGISEFPDVQEQPHLHAASNVMALRQAARARIGQRRRSPETMISGVDAQRHPIDWSIEAATGGATISQMAVGLGFHIAPSQAVPALQPRRFADPFEELRDASDDWQSRHGHRPRVFLVNMGPLSHHTARATYAKNFFEAGGFEVISNNGFQEADDAAAALSASGASIAVVCSSDTLYPQVVPQVVPKLKPAGARKVILAGNPGDNEAAWRQAGVDRFIFVQCDILATLRELLQEEGVLPS